MTPRWHRLDLCCGYFLSLNQGRAASPLSHICFSRHALHHWTLRVFLFELRMNNAHPFLIPAQEPRPPSEILHPGIVVLDRIKPDRHCGKCCSLEVVFGGILISSERKVIKTFPVSHFHDGNCQMGQRSSTFCPSQTRLNSLS